MHALPAWHRLYRASWMRADGFFLLFHHRCRLVFSVNIDRVFLVFTFLGFSTFHRTYISHIVHAFAGRQDSDSGTKRSVRQIPEIFFTFLHCPTKLLLLLMLPVCCGKIFLYFLRWDFIFQPHHSSRLFPRICCGVLRFFFPPCVKLIPPSFFVTIWHAQKFFQPISWGRDDRKITQYQDLQNMTAILLGILFHFYLAHIIEEFAYQLIFFLCRCMHLTLGPGCQAGKL